MIRGLTTCATRGGAGRTGAGNALACAAAHRLPADHLDVVRGGAGRRMLREVSVWWTACAQAQDEASYGADGEETEGCRWRIYAGVCWRGVWTTVPRTVVPWGGGAEQIWQWVAQVLGVGASRYSRSRTSPMPGRTSRPWAMPSSGPRARRWPPRRSSSRVACTNRAASHPRHGRRAQAGDVRSHGSRAHRRGVCHLSRMDYPRVAARGVPVGTARSGTREAKP